MFVELFRVGVDGGHGLSCSAVKDYFDINVRLMPLQTFGKGLIVKLITEVLAGLLCRRVAHFCGSFH